MGGSGGAHGGADKVRFFPDFGWERLIVFDQGEAAILGMSAINASGSGAVGGGGCMTAADDVVQPFHLPRSQFQPVVDEDGSATERAGGSRRWEEAELVVEAGEGVVEDSSGGVVYALHTMDVDSEEEMVEVDTVRDNDSKGPKTMRELAEDAEEERRRMGVREGTGEVEVMDIGPLSGAAALNGGSRLNGSGKGDGDAGVRPRRVNGKGRGSGRNVSTAATPTRGPKSETQGGRGTSARRSRGRGTSVRGSGRKRRRDESENDEVDEEDDTAAFDSEDDASGHGEDEDTCPSLPRKKPRSAPSVSGPAPAAEGRTLRPRKSKTAAQLHEEEEQEEAYRRAVGR